MTVDTGDSEFEPLFRLLVAYRLPIYLGGVAVIALPIVLADVFGTVIPAGARTAIVVVTIAVMIATYVGERRLDGTPDGDDATEPDRPTYPLRTRIAMTMALLGVAVGIFVALEVDLAAGILFILGAYLFGYIGYRNAEVD